MGKVRVAGHLRRVGRRQVRVVGHLMRVRRRR